MPVSTPVRLSIIIPTLNEAMHIVATLTALQPFRPTAEIIVVDGGSHDQTTHLAAALVDHLIAAPQGRAVQMNAGAQQATGPLLLFLHADTFLPADAFAALLALPAAPAWGRFDIELIGRHPLLKIVALGMNWRSRLTGIATGDQGIFVSRDLFQAVGHYSAIALMEDIDLSRKLNAITAPRCMRCKIQSSARRWEQFGLLKTILLMWSLRLRYFFGAAPEQLALLYREGVFWQR